MGRFPTAEEVEKYRILADFPALLPMDPIHNDPEWFSLRVWEQIGINIECLQIKIMLFIAVIGWMSASNCIIRSLDNFS